MPAVMGSTCMASGIIICRIIFLLGYAGLNEDEIKKGIRQLTDTHIFSAVSLSRDI